MFPESIKYDTGNIMAAFAVLGSGKLVFRSRCSPNRLNTPRGTLWPLMRFLEVVSWFSDPNVPESIKYTTGDIVGSYAVLGSGKLTFRTEGSPNRLNTPRGTLCPITRLLEVVNWFSDPNVPRLE